MMLKYITLGIVALSIACSDSRSATGASKTAPNVGDTPPTAGSLEGTSQSKPSSGLTVLVPEEMTREESTQPGFAVSDSHYSLTRRDERTTLSLTGSVVNRDEAAIETPPRAPAGVLRGVPVYVTENDGIKTATWIEKGTAYALDIECTSAKDTRCTSPDYIMSVLKGLVAKAPSSR
jgi:hypothetical protein